MFKSFPTFGQHTFVTSICCGGMLHFMALLFFLLLLIWDLLSIDRTQSSLWVRDMKPYTKYRCDVRTVSDGEKSKWSSPVINLTLEGGETWGQRAEEGPKTEVTGVKGQRKGNWGPRAGEVKLSVKGQGKGNWGPKTGAGKLRVKEAEENRLKGRGGRLDEGLQGKIILRVFTKKDRKSLHLHSLMKTLNLSNY